MPLAPFLKNSLNQTNLDVENPQPSGGPNNFPDYNHRHKYSPTNTYLDSSTPGGNGSGTNSLQSSVKSNFGINGNHVNNNGRNIFKDGTNLDIENPNPIGGPNRNNAGASNIPDGFYQTTTLEGPLLDSDGNIVNTVLHRYLPNNKYEDSFTPDELPSNSTF